MGEPEVLDPHTGELISTDSGVLQLPGRVSRTGWALAPSMGYEEWAAYGPLLQSLGASINWITGDWLRHGEENYSDLYAQAIEATGHEIQTLMNWAYVARSVAPERRLESLTFSHHCEIAPLDAEQQTYWLQQAHVNGWTRNELRQAIKQTKDETAKQYSKTEMAKKMRAGVARVWTRSPQDLSDDAAALLEGLASEIRETKEVATDE